MTPTDGRLCVMVLAGGAGWEAGVLRGLGDAGIVVTKRCVDLPDLMASAAAGGAVVAVVAGDLPHLDAEAVMHLLRYDVRTLGVSADPGTAERLARMGVVETVAPEPAEVVAAVGRVAVRDVVVDPAPLQPAEDGRLDADGRAGGRVVVVWGPTGAPGRTTVAIGLADELAAGGRSVVLVDADPYGGMVAQQLGILDEVSGLLAVARMANLGLLDDAALARACRRVGGRLDVLTGLPRADRRVEVRPDVLGTVLGTAARTGDVVVDCGFGLEDAEVPLARDRMTLDALAAADELVVVGSAEPGGLARLARGLVELRDVAGGVPVRVVVNRMRSTLGWSERDIVGMVEGYARPVAVHFLPEDRGTVDRALVGGRLFSELGESELRAGLAAVATAMRPTGSGERDAASVTFGRARPRCVAVDWSRGGGPMSDDVAWLGQAIDLAVRNVAEGGGPFGAVVVLGDTLVSTGQNGVTRELDPTAHAEIQAIRAACRQVGDFSLAGMVLYASCEPCPMCIGAALWARLDRVVHAADREDAARGGFDDRWFHDLFGRDRSTWPIRVEAIRVDDALAPFEAWLADAERVPY